MIDDMLIISHYGSVNGIIRQDFGLTYPLVLPVRYDKDNRKACVSINEKEPKLDMDLDDVLGQSKDSPMLLFEIKQEENIELIICEVGTKKRLGTSVWFGMEKIREGLAEKLRKQYKSILLGATLDGTAELPSYQYDMVVLDESKKEVLTKALKKKIQVPLIMVSPDIYDNNLPKKKLFEIWDHWKDMRVSGIITDFPMLLEARLHNIV